ncbi:MAG: glycosyltransferase family A protein [Kiritimatiellia bacterium]
MHKYIIISAVRNEAAYIEETIKSVTAQSVPPRKWIIVSNGSTDSTDAIILRHAASHPFIKLISTKMGTSRNFASKARAINMGYALARFIPCDFVAVLDADVSFGPAYYETIMNRFGDDPHLGIGGGVLYDNCDGVYVRQTVSVNWSVSGPIQMFRRSCFEGIGGYQALPHGGIDAVAEITARMKGWNVRTFTDLKVRHHRRTGSEKGSPLKTCFRDGIKEYGYGCHPAFVLAKSLSRLTDPPYVLGSVLRLAGYGVSWMRHEPRSLSAEYIASIRREQVARLADIFKKNGLRQKECA